jgi:hypothetical protein
MVDCYYTSVTSLKERVNTYLEVRLLHLLNTTFYGEASALTPSVAVRSPVPALAGVIECVYISCTALRYI